MDTAKIKTQYDDMIAQQLNRLGVAGENLTILQNKDGITVARMAGDC